MGGRIGFACCRTFSSCNQKKDSFAACGSHDHERWSRQTLKPNWVRIMAMLALTFFHLAQRETSIRKKDLRVELEVQLAWDEQNCGKKRRRSGTSTPIQSRVELVGEDQKLIPNIGLAAKLSLSIRCTSSLMFLAQCHQALLGALEKGWVKILRKMH